MAISVLPKPTSPHTSRSMGTGCSMSRLTASAAAAWSGVSSYSKAASISRCQTVSGEKAKPREALRFA